MSNAEVSIKDLNYLATKQIVSLKVNAHIVEEKRLKKMVTASKNKS